MRRALILVTGFVAGFVGAVPAEAQTAAEAPTARLYNLLPGAAWEDSRGRDQVSYACQDLTPGVWRTGQNSVLVAHLKIMLNGSAPDAAWFHSRRKTNDPRYCDLRKGYDVVTWEMSGPIDWNHFPNAVIVARVYPDQNPGFRIANGAPKWGSAVWGNFPTGATAPLGEPTVQELVLDPEELGR